MTFFGLKHGQDLDNRAAHPHQEFSGVPPPLGHLVKLPRPKHQNYHKIIFFCLEVSRKVTKLGVKCKL